MKNFSIIMILFFMTLIPLFYISSNGLRKFFNLNLVMCVALATLIGIYSPNIQIFFGAIALLFLSTVQGRVPAVCRYILLAAFIPEIQWQIGAAGHFFGTIDSAGLLAITAYVMAKVGENASFGTTGRGWGPEDFLVLTVFLVFTIGGAGFDKFNDSLRTWTQQFLLILMPYILFRSTIKTTSDFRAAIACLGIAAVFLAVFAIYEARMRADLFDVISKHLTGIYVREMAVRGGMMRASATMGGPLPLACFMTVGIIALACSRDFFRNALGYYGCLIVAFMGLVTTQSRGSMIALGASALVLSLALRKWAIAAGVAIVAVTAWPTLQVLAAASPAVASFINGGSEVHTGKYFDYRNLLLERGLQVAANHPLTGMRMAQVIDALADIQQGEHIVDLVNVYLVILLISGMVGLLPFLGLTLTSGVRAITGFKRVTDQSLLRARGFVIAAFTAVLVQFGFMSFIGRIPMLFVFTMFGIRLMVQQRQAIGTVVNLPVGREVVSPVDQWVLDEGEAPWRPLLPMGS